jgi:sterol desaturase/sphingolipid hydroxylase (fatty acid hydroxylase superfamily)
VSGAWPWSRVLPVLVTVPAVVAGTVERPLLVVGFVVCAMVFIPLEQLLPLVARTGLRRTAWVDVAHIVGNRLPITIGTGVTLAWLAPVARAALPEEVRATVGSWPVGVQFVVALLVADLAVSFFVPFLVHADTRLTLRWLSPVFVTPAFHHWHHAREPDAVNRNYSSVFSFWDRVFGWWHLPDRMPSAYGIEGARCGDRRPGAVPRVTVPVAHRLCSDDLDSRRRQAMARGALGNPYDLFAEAPERAAAPAVLPLLVAAAGAGSLLASPAWAHPVDLDAADTIRTAVQTSPVGVAPDAGLSGLLRPATGSWGGGGSAAGPDRHGPGAGPTAGLAAGGGGWADLAALTGPIPDPGAGGLPPWLVAVEPDHPAPPAPTPADGTEPHGAPPDPPVDGPPAEPGVPPGPYPFPLVDPERELPPAPPDPPPSSGDHVAGWGGSLVEEQG